MQVKQTLWVLGAFVPFLLWLYIVINEELDPLYIPGLANNNEFLMNYWYVIFVVFVYIITIFFISHVFKNNKFSEKEKYGWSIAMILFNILLNPYYWWKYIKD